MNKKYTIVLGKDIKAGQIIVHNCQRLLVTQATQGRGAGSLEWSGEYISLDVAYLIDGKIDRPDGSRTFRNRNIWTYPNCPMILETQVDNTQKK